jgi:hypothetical protein
MAANGGPARQLTFDHVWKEQVAWMPDGRRILFPSLQPSTGRLWQIALVLPLQLISRTGCDVGSGRTAPGLDVCAAKRTKRGPMTAPPFSATPATTADAGSPARSGELTRLGLCGEFSFFRRFPNAPRPHHRQIRMREQ